MNWQNFLNSFGFYKHAPFNQDIEPQWFLTGELFLLDHHHFLADANQAAEPKFFLHAPLIDGFNKPRPFIPMHLNRGSDNCFCQSRCLLV